MLHVVRTYLVKSTQRQGRSRTTEGTTEGAEGREARAGAKGQRVVADKAGI